MGQWELMVARGVKHAMVKTRFAKGPLEQKQQVLLRLLQPRPPVLREDLGMNIIFKFWYCGSVSRSWKNSTSMTRLRERGWQSIASRIRNPGFAYSVSHRRSPSTHWKISEDQDWMIND